MLLLALLMTCPAAGAAPPATPTITEPSMDGRTLNPADVHMEASGYSDPDGSPHHCSDWEIAMASTGEVAWQAPCVTGVLAVHIHLGDGTFVNSHAGRSELNFETAYVLRVRFRDSTGASPWAERPFSTSPAGPPGVPAAVPWTPRQQGYQVEVVATGFQLPVNIAFVPNPGPDPGDPFMYVTELYGTIKVVTRDGTVGDYATNLLNFNPTGNFPGSGEQGLTGIAVDAASGDVIASMVYENTASPSRPHYPKVVRFHSNDGGLTAASSSTVLDMFGQDTAASHQISAVTFGPDGKLYVNNGDGFNVEASKSIDTFRGKVLRMNLDGSPVPGNPHYDPVNGFTARDYLFAYGFRNPFGGAWRTADSSLYAVENGPSVDRFTKVVLGRNYLWDGTDASMRNYALYNWEPSHAPVNIAFVQPQTFFGSGFPAGDMDHAFVTESGSTYAGGPQAHGKRIVEFAPGANGDFAGTSKTPLIEYTGTGKATAAGLAAGPDGLYFTDLYKDQGASSAIARGANVLRVRYVEKQGGYPRPNSARQTRMSLVPAYAACVASNRTHGPPLASPSCAPPVRHSNDLLHGSAFRGSARLIATPGNSATTADEADVQLRVSISDVKRAGNLADYTGELESTVGLRLTDRHNGPALDAPATSADFSLRFVVPCTATAGSSTGADCEQRTTADALAPGMVVEGKRAIWQMRGTEVRDGGPDGDADTEPNAPFARPGIFIP